MKKLLFLIPIVLWVACYFVWKYSIPFTELRNGIGLWWVFTDVFMAIAVIGSFIYAGVNQN